MSPQQQQYYNQILNYLTSLPPQTKFCLDKSFYQKVLPTANLTSGDKIVISKYFKQQVLNNAIKVKFDYIYSNCKRCGYKDTQNHIHYITI